MKSIQLCFLILGIFVLKTEASVICSEVELLTELREDIRLNGKLDCLRQIYPPEEEDPDQKDLRVAAQWDGDCSFEAENIGEADWYDSLLKNYEVSKGLVDVNGSPVEKDFDEQADMCEIVRALMASKVFPGVEDVRRLTEDMVEALDCPGPEGQTEVCAATGSSQRDKKGWYVMLDGAGINFDGMPRYVKQTNPADALSQT
mmetsp:Transcript_2565/g.2666  ORF Transcript_2565/g.2666 Transcript_2565/m.2666 type:complete len:202 (+) Transcript_2565:111-716(+)|eukprot:CAMPEP_0114987864 /NCGR_PEP_ID=MMETSP0216-20121206/9263_1 /TAXON_ID=223996 /ORGANISM="Protocruzia adherens, Strain Boccale" /LENGTH=201 /DNA_ID=CAMNT_0002350547 /DNA_START=102 /DNA_END=707 /DNA_ORIENTATION=-